MLKNQPQEKVQLTVEQFEKYFEIYRYVSPYLSIEEPKKSLIEKKQGLISKLQETEFHVAFLGSFSAGKSTMINGILGRAILPEANESTTAFPTIIRKAAKDEVIVSFMDEQGRKELWNSFVTKISDKIGKNLMVNNDEAQGRHFQRIEMAIEEYEKSTSSSIDRKDLNTLQSLLKQSQNPEYKGKKNIKLDQLQTYVEGYAGAMFIDKIEVFLQEFKISDDIVLVDLPGLGVDNKRHVTFTKNYIKEKAKAFVVCISPFNVLQGEEIQFISEINKYNPTIIQRAFWVINQWDLPNKTQKKEALNSFNKRVHQYNLNIKQERQFQTSALNYLILKSIAEGTIEESKKLKSHRDNLKRLEITDNVDTLNKDQAKSLLTHTNVREFSQFVDALFAYLNKEAKEEFITDTKKELLQIIRALDVLLKPLDEQYSQSTDLEKEMEAVAISQKSRLFIDKLKAKVEEFTKGIRTDEKQDFWLESDTIDIIREIDKRIMQIDRKELINEVSKGEDIESNLSRLPSIIEKKIGLTLLIRERLILVIEDFFIQPLSKLLTGLETIEPHYFPEEVRNQLADKLDERDISMRLNGLADALFYQYGEKLEEIGLNIKQCEGQTLAERIDNVLVMYKTELDKFTRNLVLELNKNIRRSLKNHTEYLHEALLELFEESRNKIISQVARNINLNDAIKTEMKKQQIITSNYAELVKLKTVILSSLGNQNDENLPNNDTHS
ncbi:MAG: dynamin family protein [Crocosphaera sp.]